MVSAQSGPTETDPVNIFPEISTFALDKNCMRSMRRSSYKLTKKKRRNETHFNFEAEKR